MIARQPPQSLRLGLRRLWPLDAGIVFLNHGSFGGSPRCVAAAQARWRRRIDAEPVEMIARRLPGLLDEVKAAVGGWLGMAPGDFGLVTNATEGVNAVLRSLSLREGDELLTTSHVYNAVRLAMQFAAGRAGAEYREVDLPLPLGSPDAVVRRVAAALSPRTRLLIVDHITSPTALIFPVEQIVRECRLRGVETLIDGAHAPGMLPLNVPAIGAAYYAGNLHKWACAPRGSGFLWVRPDRQAGVHPLIISHYHGQGFAAELGWQGTRDFSGWLAIPRALEFMADLGWEAVMRHNRELTRWVHALLLDRWNVAPIAPRGGEMTGAMVTVPLPPPFDQLTESQADSLQKRLYGEGRIEAMILRWAGRSYIRPCCQVYNQPWEYERLAETITRFGQSSLDSE